MKDPRAFRDLIRTLRHMRVVALTGAGCSTESGIPDYRGPETRRRARNPITFQQYMKNPATRRRYWARSAAGWPKMRDTHPNEGHEALAMMERSGSLLGLITQNVDRLHHKAGSGRVVELHGALADVRCLDCGALEDRQFVQARMLTENPGFDPQDIEYAPDGDADVEPQAIAAFRVPVCIACEGTLKPDVVFFGENVPRDVLADAWRLFDDAEALLIVGSSLAVYSGYRFVLRASERHMPVAMVNLGDTRGDDLVWAKVDGACGEILPALADALASEYT